MTTLETVLLGIIQGLTEFLPISSSGHLVIFQNCLGFKEPEILFDGALHLGTLLAVCLYFRNEIKQTITEIGHRNLTGPNASVVWGVIIGTLPTSFMALTLKDRFESFYASTKMVGLMLMVTGVILIVPWAVFKVKKYKNKFSFHPNRRGIFIALTIGAVQGFAIIPGISRSGITIACGLLCGLDRELAGRFSFLLSIPMIVGWNVLNLSKKTTLTVGLPNLFIGFGSAAIAGFLALKLLMDLLTKGRLHYFTPYCLITGFIIVVLTY